MARKSIMIDMDEVIVKCRFSDFLEDFLGDVDFSKLTGFNRQELIKGREKEFAEIYAKKSLYNNDDGTFVEPMENCVQVIEKLSKVYDVYIETSYTWGGDVIDPAWNLKYKCDYLKHYFPFLSVNNFMFICDKSKIKFDVGIDDRVHNLVACDKKLLFTEFRNKNLADDELENLGISRVDNWLEIEKVLLPK